MQEKLENCNFDLLFTVKRFSFNNFHFRRILECSLEPFFLKRKRDKRDKIMIFVERSRDHLPLGFQTVSS